MQKPVCMTTDWNLFALNGKRNQSVESSFTGSPGKTRMASMAVVTKSTFKSNDDSRGAQSCGLASGKSDRFAFSISGLIMDDHEGRIMHRMRHSLTFSLIALLMFTAGIARADLIQPNAVRSYPDIAADVNGVVNYTYSNGSGLFTMKNTPFLLATGPNAGDEATILPTSDGVRSQSISVALDSSGKFVSSDLNTYQLYGSTTVGGQSFSGLLLQGTPTAFGSQDNGQFDAFDLSVKVTGGALASAFGTNAYVLIRPELQSSFTGVFDSGFSAQKATSNTRGNYNPVPPVPEPATWMILIGGGAGLAMVNRRRMRQAAQRIDD